MQEEGTDMAPLALLVPKWLHRIAPGRPLWQLGLCLGYTLIELLVSLALVATITGIAVPVYKNHLENVAMEQAIIDVRMLEKELALFEAAFARLPSMYAPDYGLVALRKAPPLDPWGNPYQYLNYAEDEKHPVTGEPKNARRDHQDHPLNTTYDLFSMGKDGLFGLPLTNSKSADDVVRANDGLYVGRGDEF
jgi:general secretion pathway protein G